MGVLEFVLLVVGLFKLFGLCIWVGFVAMFLGCLLLLNLRVSV